MRSEKEWTLLDLRVVKPNLCRVYDSLNKNETYDELDLVGLMKFGVGILVVCYVTRLMKSGVGILVVCYVTRQE